MQRCAVSGCATPTIVWSGAEGASPSDHWIAVDATDIYWTEGLTHSILKCPLAGCGAGGPTIVSKRSATPYELTLSGSTIIWAEMPSGATSATIFTLPK